MKIFTHNKKYLELFSNLVCSDCDKRILGPIHFCKPLQKEELNNGAE